VKQHWPFTLVGDHDSLRPETNKEKRRVRSRMRTAAVGEVHAGAGGRHISVVFSLMFGGVVWEAFTVRPEVRQAQAGADEWSRECGLCNA
jgi:hypothetical protein